MPQKPLIPSTHGRHVLTCYSRSVPCTHEIDLMAAQGRGSAGAASGALLVLFLGALLIHGLQVAEAVTYVVGDSGGWTFNSAGWPSGKRFRAGDVLIFKYNPSAHNLVAVSAAGYRSCSAPGGSRAFTSGSDRITLARGTNYFICTFPGHCQSGMKVAISAA